MPAKYLVFTRTESQFTGHCSITDLPLTRIAGSAKTETNSFHPPAKSCLVLLPLWRLVLLSSW